jgi:multidrug efflux pump subunit AcrA (membrane-fusion protein)
MKRTSMLVVGLYALLCFASCKSSKKEKEKEGETKYLVTTPVKMDTSVVKEYVSQIRSFRNIELRAQEKGYLQNIFVDEAQFVKEVQLLFKIMPKVYEAELEKAQANQVFTDIKGQ